MAYNINYKANDDRNSDYIFEYLKIPASSVVIVKFIESLDYKWMMQDTPSNNFNWLIFRKDNDELAVSPPRNTVSKLRRSNYIALTNEELEFFDNSGYDLEPGHAKWTGQNIEDWFGR